MTESDLWAAYHATRSIEDRNALVVYHEPHLRHIAVEIRRKWNGDRLIEVDDLVNDAIPALMELVETFDPSRGIKFGTYSTRRLHGAIIDALRERDWVPRRERQLRRHDPSHPIVLIFPLRVDRKRGDVALFEGSVVSWDPPDQRRDTSIDDDHFWHMACRHLNQVDRLILLLYFREGLSLREIGVSLNRSESRMSQRLRVILDHLRRRQDLDELEAA